MEAKLFTQMLTDKNFNNLRKLQYKYSKAAVCEMISLLKDNFYKPLSINSFNGCAIVYLENIKQINMSTMRQLLMPISSTSVGTVESVVEEIHSTLNIESIYSVRDSIKSILNGAAPRDDSEQRVYGIKKGLEFISDRKNKITENSLHALYNCAIGDYLEEDDMLSEENFYRHDAVYIVGNDIEHMGLPASKLADYMGNLIRFIDEKSDMSDLLKAAVIHFYIAYLHPYFDGNGRMARLVHMWYLVEHGYSQAMFIPFSKYISESKKAYYTAYTQIESNVTISGILDITPFLSYFVENVYNKFPSVVYSKLT